MFTLEQAGWRTRQTGPGTLECQLEQHRGELTGLCCRMLGPCDAEDAVQETLVKAWRAFDRFEGRAALRSWLYRIATNVCLDILDTRRRRAGRFEDMASDPAWESPIDPALDSPAETVVLREAVRDAFAALVRLPARQRAVLIGRDVLRWKADEVAELLDTTVASVNGALQRARSTLAARKLHPVGSHPPENAPQRELLARCLDAFDRYDLDELTSILRDDVWAHSVTADGGPSVRVRAHRGGRR